MIAYKLFHKRPDGTLGPLYCGRALRVPLGQWVEAECHPTKRIKVRPFWHCAARPYLGLIKIGARDSGRRSWYRVEMREFEEFSRSSTETWYLARWIKVIEEVTSDDLGGSH